MNLLDYPVCPELFSDGDDKFKASFGLFWSSIGRRGSSNQAFYDILGDHRTIFGSVSAGPVNILLATGNCFRWDSLVVDYVNGELS